MSAREAAATPVSAAGDPRRRRRIAHLTSAHPPFDGRIFHKEATTLARAGYEVVVVAAHERDDMIDGVRIRAVPVPRHGRRSRMTATMGAVWRAALDEDADLYHFHDPELIPLGIRLKLAGKRVVYDAHEDLPRQIMSKHWIRPWMRRSVSRAAAAAEHGGERLFDAIVAATPAIARRFRAERTVVVPNFPRLDELISTSARPMHERPPVLAYVGRISAVRGIREMVRAMMLLPAPLNARLHLAGTFSQEGLEDVCAREPGWQHVVPLGWQSRAEVADLLGQARAGLVLFHPEPNHVEAQPNKLFEYMAAGVPVIASDFPLWRRMIETAGCGLLVDPQDPEAIAHGCRRLLEDPEVAVAMGQRGREAVLKTYNWDVGAQQLLALYQRLLS